MLACQGERQHGGRDRSSCDVTVKMDERGDRAPCGGSVAYGRSSSSLLGAPFIDFSLASTASASSAAARFSLRSGRTVAAAAACAAAVVVSDAGRSVAPTL